MDDAEAVRWYRLAADQGFATSQHSLGVAYGGGFGVPVDLAQAHMWLDLAASQSSGEVRDEVMRLRDTVAGRMTPDQITEAQRLAREWDAAHPREPF